MRGFDLSQEGGDVDASVLRCKRPEAAGGLFELTLAPRLVAAPSLVPGDDDVHEALEEVLLLRLGRSPGVLERLVGGEVLARAGEVETQGEISRQRLGRCRPRP